MPSALGDGIGTRSANEWSRCPRGGTEGHHRRNQEGEAVRMVHGGTRDLLFALMAALLVTAGAWLWRRSEPWSHVKRARAWLWNVLHKKQLEEIAELRQDVDALLSVLDHWVTPGAGDKQRQFEYMAEVLNARGKRGISGADMRVARLIDNDY